MNTKRIGYGALRTFVWLLIAWVLVRGLVSFLPESASSASSATANSLSTTAGTSQQALATLFAFEFLTWQPGDAEEHAERIAPYLAPDLDPQAGWTESTRQVGQRATNSWVAGARQLSPTRWLVTTAVRVERFGSGPSTASNSVIYLAVPVGQTSAGGWVVYDYPTLVAPPAKGAFTEPLHFGSEIPDQNDQIKGLLAKFFPAYLNGNQEDLAYLLAPESKIQAFKSPWSFDSLGNLILSQTDSGVYALVEVVLADPATGTRYISRYTIALAQSEDRWYIAEILQESE